MGTQSRGERDWRDTGWLIAAEFGLFGLIFALDQPGLHLILISKTLYLAVLAALSLTIRHAWRQAGFALSPFVRLVLLGILGGVAMEGLELFVTQPFLLHVFREPPDLSDFAALKGDLSLLALYLGLTWTLAAFGEEFVYRAYLLNRIADLFGRTRVGWILALVLSSAIFGLAHLYQGRTGISENVIDGLLLGVMYLASGRRFIVPFMAHGIQDTVDILLIFSGHYPTMH